MQKDIVFWLYTWQTMIGAFVGGITGFIAAIWVARDARYREEVAASHMIILDLLAIKAKTEGLTAQYGDNKNLFVWNYLIRKPIVSPLFDTYISILTSISDDLSPHLLLVRKIMFNIEESISRMERRIFESEFSGEKMKSSQLVSADVDTIYDGLQKVIKYSDCAIFYIEYLVLSRIRFFKKIRLKFFCGCNKDILKKCKDLLAKGN